MLKHWREGLLSASEDETPVEALLLQPEIGNGGLLDLLSVSLPCLDVLMIHPQPVCVVDDLFVFLMMRNLVYAKFLLYLRRIIAVEQQMLLLLCYQTLSAGFEMLTGDESSFILQNECS